MLVTIDTLRADRVGAYGRAGAGTPALDRLAAEGVRFDRAQTTAPLTLPAHASILTGLYAHSHGVHDNFTELPAGLTHWPMRLRESGYETAYVGKWHMGENNDAPRPGFDYFATHKGQGKYLDTEWNRNGTGTKPILYCACKCAMRTIAGGCES